MKVEKRHCGQYGTNVIGNHRDWTIVKRHTNKWIGASKVLVRSEVTKRLEISLANAMIMIRQRDWRYLADAMIMILPRHTGRIKFMPRIIAT